MKTTNLCPFPAYVPEAEREGGPKWVPQEHKYTATMRVTRDGVTTTELHCTNCWRAQ